MIHWQLESFSSYYHLYHHIRRRHVQAKGRLLRTLLAVLVISLALGACSGGAGGGSTWFNLPSIPVTVDANGNGTVLGFPIGQVLQQSLLDQFAVAGVDVLEVRIGYQDRKSVV